MFGPHLILDCQSNSSKLGDPDFIEEFLSSLVEKIEMTVLIDPIVLYVNNASPGVTGVAIIAESHISIHTFPEKNFFFIDIFSCKEFDTDLAEQFIIEAFDVEEYDEHKVIRGVNYNEDGS